MNKRKISMKGSAFIILMAFVFFSLSCDKTNIYSPYSQLQEDIQKIDDYLSENNISAIRSASGLRYVIVDEGLGSNPVRGNLVKVSYIGK